jgi:hypothetical protein
MALHRRCPRPRPHPHLLVSSPRLWHPRPRHIPLSHLPISASASSSRLWCPHPHRPLPAIAAPRPLHAVGASDTLAHTERRGRCPRPCPCPRLWHLGPRLSPRPRPRPRPHPHHPPPCNHCSSTLSVVGAGDMVAPLTVQGKARRRVAHSHLVLFAHLFVLVSTRLRLYLFLFSCYILN